MFQSFVTARARAFWIVCRHFIFLDNFDPPPPCQTSRDPPKSTSHISDTPPNFSRPSTKNLDKSPLYKFSLNCSRGLLSGGFCPEVFCLEGFVRERDVLYGRPRRVDVVVKGIAVIELGINN